MMNSDFDVDDFLAHHGVKGMKWGVRKDGKPQGYQGPKGVRTNRKTGMIKREKANRHGIIAPGKNVVANAVGTVAIGYAGYAPLLAKRKGVGTGKKSGTARLAEKGKDISNVRDVRGVNNYGYISITNMHRRQMKKELKTFNSKWVGKDVKSPGKTRDKYLKDYAKLSQDKLRQITNDYYSGSRQSTMGVQVHVDYDPRSMKAPVMYATIETVSIKHSDDNSTRIPLPIKINDRGEIIDMDAEALFKLLSQSESKTDNDKVKHDDFDVDDFLAHYGVKGMKWGVRKDSKPQGHKGGGKSAKDFRPQKEKKSVRLEKNRSTSTARVRTDISTEQLRKINDRLRLEIDFNRNIYQLEKQTRTLPEKALKAVQEVLSNSAKKSATQLLTAKAVQIGAQQMGLNVQPKGKNKIK